ncbi:MAG: hypothetical protein OER88_06210 [Planctomycetota bacterium]|nr:hypothetical protein [Planctomycetota bacterium]
MAATSVVRDCVGRMRRRLEGVRFLRAAARGTLAGAAGGCLVLLAAKLWPAAAPPAGWAWATVLAGAGIGALLALREPAIDAASAAIYLDKKLGTRSRFATVATRDGGPVDRIAGELAVPPRLPATPLPRPVQWLPAALFVLAAGQLLPARASTSMSLPAPSAPVASATAGGAAVAGPIDPQRLTAIDAETLADPTRRQENAELISTVVDRPEDRAKAHAQLDQAQRGDAGAAKALEAALRRILAPEQPSGGAVRTVAVYAGDADFLREFRAALAEEEKQ